jgi:hypothetical protein
VIYVPPLLYPVWAAQAGAEIIDAKILPASVEEYWDSTMAEKDFSELKDKCYLLIQKPLAGQ